MSQVTVRPIGRVRKRKRYALPSALTAGPAYKRLRPSQVSRPKVAALYKGPFAQTVTTTHKYVDFVTLNAAAGVVAFDNWSLNNIYDPYDAAGGHQPLGFDQMAALYTKWIVLESEVELKVYTANGNTIPMIAYLCPGGQEFTTNVTAADVILEKPNASLMLSTSTRNSLKRKYNARKWFGKSYDPSNLTGTDSSGPTGANEVIAQLGYGPLNAGSDLNPSDFMVTIVYKVQWSQPKQVTQS